MFSTFEKSNILSVYSGLLATYSRKDHPHVPDNLLSLLSRITTFPTEQAELNTWWVEELGARPPKPKAQKPNADADESDSDDGHAKNPWHRPVHYVYDAAAERTEQRIREGRLAAAALVAGVH